MNRHPQSDHGLCGCGKVRYPSRAMAKRAAKAKHPGEHLVPYLCGNEWHVGHLRPCVLAGTLPRGQVYGR